MSLFLDLRKHGKLAEKRNPMYEKSKFGKFWMYFMFVFWAGYLIFFGTTFAFAFAVLQSCAARVHAGEEISVNDVQMAVLSEQTGTDIDDDEAFMLKTRRAGLQPRTPNQKKYLQAIMQTDVVFGVGPAGTGKTYLAVAAAVDAYERDAGTLRP